MSSIFISLSSLDDKELVPTLKNIFEASSKTHEIRVGLTLATISQDFLDDVSSFIVSSNYNIDMVYERINSDNLYEVMGVGRGRNRARSLYKNEDFFLQIDSHTWLKDSWDKDLIELYLEAEHHYDSNKVILTGYAGPYHYNENNERVPGDGDANSLFVNGLLGYPVFSHNKFFWDGVVPAWHIVPSDKLKELANKFELAVKFNANFAFARGSFAELCTVPEDSVFFEEEIVQSVELLNMGYQFVFLNIDYPIICHYYAGTMLKSGIGYRMGMQEYFEPEGALDLVRNGIEKYNGYVKSKKNKKKIEQYQKYAEVNLISGKSNDVVIVPKM